MGHLGDSLIGGNFWICHNTSIMSPIARSHSELVLLQATDEPVHQILLYTLLFSLFHHFLYITDPPLCTPSNATAHIHIHSHTTLTFTSLDQPHLFDGQMFYNSHALFPFLVAPMCALLWPDQSRILTPHSQALTIASLWMSLVLVFLFTICI